MRSHDSLETLKLWCRRGQWVRLALDQDEQERRRRAEAEAAELEETRRTRRQHRLVIAEAARAKGVEAIRLLDPRLLARHPMVIIALLTYADNCERKDLEAAPDARLELSGRGGGPIEVQAVEDYSGLTDVELETLEALLSKIRRGRPDAN
jgi:hypothetical protein